MNSGFPGLKTLGLYVLLLLGIIRLVIIPLQNSLAAKKLLTTERQALLRARQAVAQKQREEGTAQKPLVDREAVARQFYPKDLAATTIQTDLVKALIESAEQKKLTVLNFELPEVAREKELSEIGAVLRLRGTPSGLLELLRAIDDWPKTLRIKSLEANKAGAEFTVALTVTGFRIER